MNARVPNPDETSPVQLTGFSGQHLYKRRERIYTRYVGGFFQKLRFFTGWPLLIGYFVTPWLMWGDRQAVLFDLPARQFHILGLTIWPQDLWLLGWLLMIAAFGLFTMTTVVGRLWCGYTCPQTVWTAIFMWAEQLTEGQRHQRIRLDAQPMSLNKFARRTAKHTLWLGWAALTALAFVGYFTPIRPLALDLATLELGAINGWALFWLVFFTGATYVNAGWLREQVCLYMCPYARFQSAMIDRDTLVVSYDATRGEPRGSRKRGTQPADAGDCIDCQLCVQVCPTGIDIRDGLQYACIGCAHCIDACAQVMDKMDYEPGLIRYTTQNALDGGPAHWLRPRSIGYAAVCLVLMVAFTGAVFMRSTLAFDVIRERNVLFHLENNGEVRNDYELKLMNKSQADERYQLALDTPAWLSIKSETIVGVPAGDVTSAELQLTGNPPEGITNALVEIRICSSTGECQTEETRFLAPGGTKS